MDGRAEGGAVVSKPTGANKRKGANPVRQIISEGGGGGGAETEGGGQGPLDLSLSDHGDHRGGVRAQEASDPLCAAIQTCDLLLPPDLAPGED